MEKKQMEITPEIYDLDEGIKINFPLDNGMEIGLLLTDKSAQQMVNIIQNKLNGRFQK